MRRGSLWRLAARSICVGVLACTPSVLAAADLTLADGVVVKFGADAQLVVRDKLVSGKGIAFTSQKDDTLGGQSNPTAQVAAIGDWRGLRIEKSAAAFGVPTVNDLLIRYGGSGEAGAALTLRGVSPSLQYLQVTDASTGLRLLDAASPTISGSSFLRNTVGIEADGNSAPVIGSTQFSQNRSEAVLNKTPATLIQATGNWWGHASGPKDPVGNPQGQGDAVSAGVKYAGFLTAVPLLNPTVRLAAPAPFFEQSSVALELSCVNATEYRLAENGGFSGVAFQPLPNGRAAVDYTLSNGDGRKTVTAQFRDPTGTVVTATLDGGVLVDTQPPTVELTNPAAGSLIREPITIEASASDVSGIKQVQFFQGSELLVTRTAAPYSFAWNTDAVADGNYLIKAVATDQAGRVGEHGVTVTVSHAAPVPDTEGPQLAGITVDGVVLADGATFTRSTSLSFTATDRSAISRIELLLDGVVVATASGNASYTVALDLDAVANGAHTLALHALDSLGNATTASFAVTVAHAVPDAPVINAPIGGSTTRNASVAVSGHAQPGSQVQVLLNGQPVGTTVTAGVDGRFSASFNLSPGSNQIQATATDQYGSSALSAPVQVTLDTTVPAAPTNLAAALVNGKIHLSWTASSDPNAFAYEIYRAGSEFSTISEAQKLVRLPRATTAHDDVPASDGGYFYRVISLNAADVPSLPSSSASASIDRTGPYAVRIEYQPQGTYDAATATYGQGAVAIKLTVSEPLLGTPYLSVVPEGGLPMPVDLIKRDDTHYEGSLNLASGAGSGVANVLFSARDVTGNRGVDVREGATLKIDTVGPALIAIALDPAAPIKVDASRDVTAIFTYDEAIPADKTPALQYHLSGAARTPVTLAGIERIDATHWRAKFQLPADAGLPNAEQLGFASIAADALGNLSSQIKTTNAFQVYQGELPALNVPVGLTATALPGGKVQLAWQAVDGASAYQLFRQAPGETQRTPLSRSTAATATDQTPVDGLYAYSVASVRSSNGQETQSDESAVAEVRSSRNAPGAPQNLELTLGSQGVIATWQPPVGTAPASYRLYRAATATITSVDGLAPIRQGIKTPQAVDATPSQSEHAYVVTAVDAAGNESAISNSVYLNFSLLPVKTLQVEQIGSGLPVLQWTPNGEGAVGYDVYVGEGDARVKLTATPITANQLVDTGFTGGERHYTVEAVDANDVRMARSVTLPNASAQIVTGLPLKRNVMNRLGMQVSNFSATSLLDTRVVVSIGTRTFKSELFTLEPNATRIAPVVIGGYPDLPSPAAVTVAIESVPHEGERVRLGWQRQVDVVDSALVVSLDAESFVRGGSGKVRLSVENTSDVEVELLTARNNGRDASNELRLKLLDNDGNLLGTTPYQQATGAGVVTLATGQTIARIAPGQRYLSDAFVMPVPATSPDQVRLRLEVDQLHYATGQDDAVSIPGMGSERTVTLSNTPYYGEVSSASPVISSGTEDVVILGRALDRDSGAPVPNAPLKIAINQEGFERVANVTTDVDGAFRYIFKPTVTDAGEYQVGAIHPDMTDRPNQARFTINRVNVGPSTFKLSVPRNYAYKIDYRATTGTGSQATNLRVVYAPEYQPSGMLLPGIKVEPGAPINIAPKQNLSLPVSVSGDNTAAPSGRLVLAVFSDGSGSTPLTLLSVDYTLTEAKPALYATPNYVQAGLSQGQSTIEKVLIENKGFVAMNDVTAGLLDKDGNAAPAWISLASDPNLGTIGIGDKRSIDLNIAPGAQVAEGIYEFRLRIAGSNLPAEDVNVFVSVTQSGQGNVLFKAADIYTATRDKNGNLIPGLAGARIFVQNEAVVSQTYELTTDAFGEAFFQNLPAGSYKFKASAQNHQDSTGRFSVKPGLIVNQPIFLEYTLISVEWSVREITIEDRYEITLNATFETDVPAPVVVLQPTSINLPKMAAGEVFQGELTLTNYGLIRADNVMAHPPEADGYYKFEFLVQPPTTLEAKQRVRLPYRVIALRSYGGAEAATPSPDPVGAVALQADGGSTRLLIPSADADAARTMSPSTATLTSGATALAAPGTASESSGVSGTAGCYTYSKRYPVTCNYTCANGAESNNCGSSANWFYVESSACPAGTNPTGGSGGSGSAGGGSGWGGSGGPGTSTLPGLPLCTKGSGDCFEPKNKQSGGGNEGGQ
ncbi:MAG: Ig-like domain-containing protein [Rhodanobacter thiooxydans]|nr:Ig-like domain-containing protein [Rhodanobacter thiooxydans]